MSYDIKEKDPTAFMRMLMSVTLDPVERDVLVTALEAYYFAEVLNERSMPLDYVSLRRKLLGHLPPKA
jgi:hypothetical protein